ncbi:neutral/alkaline non-lysosomal ceramidase N-terminal domain-containing protein [Mobilicoccus massiliensis]|uniref:neutral/alkaline non-lysosomal ceramidase N-terminal domain-containing protein n=1 Tax=Mobilicoccus massiliensis TaxID=1522310 RepID=UPI00058E0445|nr:neutral/alkaline non-lysosomal ceramidase N-terminal domain-containing protein [Mobilicoccus massiliensis]
MRAALAGALVALTALVLGVPSAAGTAGTTTAPAIATPAIATSKNATAANAAPYLVGAGMYDITGAAAETGAFGYAAQQEMTGLHTRLYSRAFVVGDPATGKRVVFVSADLGAIFPSIKTGVVRQLQQRFGSAYTDANVMITATHTHVATSGLAYETLYQIAGADSTGAGFDQRNLDTVVGGIVESVARAHANLEPGDVALASGELSGATKNRSTPAYRANKDAANYRSDVNTTMTQLNLTSASGTPIGVVNWFATHPTQFSLKTTQISADAKGYAQYTFGRRMGQDPSKNKTFVAAFANSDTGDVVSTRGNSFSAPGYEGLPNDYRNAEIDGSRQFDRASRLWNDGGTPLKGGVDSRSRWVDFGGYTVDAAYTQGEGPKKLCVPARGFSFAAGGENGPSNIPGIYEGMTKGSFSVTDAFNQVDRSPLGSLVRGTLGAFALAFQDPCQAEKPVLLATGALGWVSTTLQVQLFRIGDLAIVSMPGEPTTMAGRRLRETVRAELAGSGVTNVVIAGLANGYAGYITTREEYATQHYEGASTEFGPHELGAFRQEAAKLASAMREGRPVTDDRQPSTSRGLGTQRPGVVLDDKPAGQTFGQVLVQPKDTYARGETAVATFRGGHPKNDYRTGGTFLRIQRLEGSTWVNHLDDADWDTSFIWKREGASYSRTTVEWRIGAETPAGTYRIVQTGDWKDGWTGRVTPYTGTSQQFTVR